MTQSEKTAKAILKRLALLLALASLGACSLSIKTPSAIREEGRTLNGLISEGKASPDVEGSYWKTQKQHDGLRLGGN